MFAIIETGGKQFRVEEGRYYMVPTIAAEVGAKLSIEKVLVAGSGDSVSVGQPYVSGAKVECEILDHGREKKIVVFKKKRRKDYRKKQGHRQGFTKLKVTSILV